MEDEIDLLYAVYMAAKPNTHAESLAYKNLHDYCMELFNNYDDTQQFCHRQFQVKSTNQAIAG